MSARELVTLPISSLIEDHENPKMHTDLHVDMVAASIERYGFNDPVGVVSHEGGYLIVEGHGRVMAATQLGMTEVPCLILDHLNDTERKAYAIAHNQTQQNTTLKAGTVAEEFDRIGVTSEDHLSVGYTDEDALFLPAVIDGQAQLGWTDDTEHEDDTGGGAATTGGVYKDFVPTVHRTTLRFGSEVGYQRFVHLLQVLREQNPVNGQSIGDRVGIMLDGFGVARG